MQRQSPARLKSFKLEDYRQIEKLTLVALTDIVVDVKKMLEGLLDFHTVEQEGAKHVDEHV